MPLRRYKCPKCKSEIERLKPGAPLCPYCACDGIDETMREVLVAPSSKMMEKTDAFKGKSRQKDLTKQLKERTRNHARDHEADEMIQLNNANSLTRSGFLNKNGTRRKKVDDL